MGHVSLLEVPDQKVSVKILRDTGASQTLICKRVLLFSDASSAEFSVLLKGIELGALPSPVHKIQLNSPVISGDVHVALCEELPIKGIDVLLGNDLAGGKVIPTPELVEVPVLHEPVIFPVCVVTWSQKKGPDNSAITLENTLLQPLLYEIKIAEESPDSDDRVNQEKSDSRDCPAFSDTLSSAQKEDESLKNLFEQVDPIAEIQPGQSQYQLENGILFRCWSLPSAQGAEWGMIKQIVVPTPFRGKVISLAHESDWSGHLGINKTYNLLIQHFIWPDMKKQVAEYCKSFHVCQMVGKPNQKIRPVPLSLVPVVTTLFEHIVVDCVGPLPVTKSGKMFLLTIMCSSTRFPEATPLSSITTRSLQKP
nr:uncharacterized protein LOC107373038 [Nothobranchius furzeri]